MKSPLEIFMLIQKKAALAMLLLSLSTSAFAAWVKFGENDRVVSYYGPIKASGSGSVTVWVMYDYKAEQAAQRSRRRYFSQKGQQEVDCSGQRSRTVFFTWHAAGMGEGAVIYTGSNAFPWEPDSPGSSARALSSVLCNRK